MHTPTTLRRLTLALLTLIACALPARADVGGLWLTDTGDYLLLATGDDGGVLAVWVAGTYQQGRVLAGTEDAGTLALVSPRMAIDAAFEGDEMAGLIRTVTYGGRRLRDRVVSETAFGATRLLSYAGSGVDGLWQTSHGHRLVAATFRSGAETLTFVADVVEGAGGELLVDDTFIGLVEETGDGSSGTLAALSAATQTALVLSWDGDAASGYTLKGRDLVQFTAAR